MWIDISLHKNMHTFFLESSLVTTHQHTTWCGPWFGHPFLWRGDLGLYISFANCWIPDLNTDYGQNLCSLPPSAGHGLCWHLVYACRHGCLWVRQLQHVIHFFSVWKYPCGFLWTMDRGIGAVRMSHSDRKLPEVKDESFSQHCTPCVTSQACYRRVLNQRKFANHWGWEWLWAGVYFCFPICKSGNVIYTPMASFIIGIFLWSDWGVSYKPSHRNMEYTSFI